MQPCPMLSVSTTELELLGARLGAGQGSGAGPGQGLFPEPLETKTWQSLH